MNSKIASCWCRRTAVWSGASPPRPRAALLFRAEMSKKEKVTCEQTFLASMLKSDWHALPCSSVFCTGTFHPCGALNSNTFFSPHVSDRLDSNHKSKTHWKQTKITLTMNIVFLQSLLFFLHQTQTARSLCQTFFWSPAASLFLDFADLPWFLLSSSNTFLLLLAEGRNARWLTCDNLSRLTGFQWHMHARGPPDAYAACLGFSLTLSVFTVDEQPLVLLV